MIIPHKDKGYICQIEANYTLPLQTIQVAHQGISDHTIAFAIPELPLISKNICRCWLAKYFCLPPEGIWVLSLIRTKKAGNLKDLSYCYYLNAEQMAILVHLTNSWALAKTIHQ